jgi:hypothetical protein
MPRPDSSPVKGQSMPIARRPDEAVQMQAGHRPEGCLPPLRLRPRRAGTAPTAARAASRPGCSIVIASGDEHGQAIAAKADAFAATLLRPLNDFRALILDQPISCECLGRSADGYGVSLTAAVLGWLDRARGRRCWWSAGMMFMRRALSNRAPLRSGASFRHPAAHPPVAERRVGPPLSSVVRGPSSEGVHALGSSASRRR